MNYFELGAGILAGSSFIGWIAYIELRLRQVQGQLIQSRQKNADDAAIQKTRALSDSELDALVKSDVARDPKT